MKYQAIIFDLGNVLIDFDHRIAANRIARFTPLDSKPRGIMNIQRGKHLTGFTEKSPEEIFQLFFDSELTSLFEKGKISPEEFFEEVKKILGLNLTFGEFLPIWNEIFFLTPINQEVHKIVRQVNKTLPILLLSNINKLHFEYLKERFSIFEEFSKLVLSYEVGLRKPDPEIYRLAIKSLNSIPKQTFYVEDRLELVLAAQELGIAGLHFNGNESLERLRSELFSLKIT